MVLTTVLTSLPSSQAEIDAPLSSVEYAAAFKPPTVRVVSVEGGEEALDGGPPADVQIAYDVSPVKSKSSTTAGSSLAKSHIPGFSLGSTSKSTTGAFKPPTMKPVENAVGASGCWTSNWYVLPSPYTNILASWLYLGGSGKSKSTNHGKALELSNSKTEP